MRPILLPTALLVLAGVGLSQTPPIPALPPPKVTPAPAQPEITPVGSAPAAPGGPSEEPGDPDLPAEPPPLPETTPNLAEPPVLPSTPVLPFNLRGLWVDAFGPGLKTRQQVKQVVDDAVKLKVNTLFVQAIRRGDCLCLKSTLPVIPDADLEKNFDPLGTITALAHQKGLRVIAWASVTGIANNTVPNLSARHVMQTNGPKSGAQSWLARRPDGSWQEGKDAWLDAAIPAAAEFITQGVLSLVRQYPIDGIQLDRIRYPDGGDWGYDPKVLARYQAETGVVGTPLPSDEAWQSWKRAQVTALVRRIALEAKRLRPELWTSAATITYGTAPDLTDPSSFQRSRPYLEVLQDWPTWLREGLIDLNVPMNYRRDGVEQQTQDFDGWNTFAQSVRTRADGQSSGLAVGTALYLNPVEVTIAQVKRSVNPGWGWVGYSYRTPTLAVYRGQETAAKGLSSVIGALTAPTAPLAQKLKWIDPPPSQRGFLGRLVGTPWPGTKPVEVYRDGELVAQTTTDGNGYFGVLALEAGPVEVRLGTQRLTTRIPEQGVVRLPDMLGREFGKR